nr:hypothetical protein [Thermoclostridium caenicola]
MQKTPFYKVWFLWVQDPKSGFNWRSVYPAGSMPALARSRCSGRRGHTGSGCTIRRSNASADRRYSGGVPDRYRGYPHLGRILIKEKRQEGIGMAITMSVNEQWAVFHPCTGMETGKRTAPSHMKKNGFDFISKRLKIFRRKREVVK